MAASLPTHGMPSAGHADAGELKLDEVPLALASTGIVMLDRSSRTVWSGLTCFVPLHVSSNVTVRLMTAPGATTPRYTVDVGPGTTESPSAVIVSAKTAAAASRTPATARTMGLRTPWVDV